MANYQDSNLLEKRTLAVEDLLTIARIVYRVEEYDGRLCLSNQDNCSNDDDVFFILGIPDRMDFCRSHYGYDPPQGPGFPETKPNDFRALTRAALTLMKESERQGYNEIPNTYRSAAELEAEKLLYKDAICFGKYGVYTVEIDEGGQFFLFTTGKKRNDQIFQDLKLNPEDFCQEHYGYELEGGVFPQTKPGDLAALKRVIMALFKELEKLKQ